MKFFCFIFTAALCSAPAFAQWSTDRDVATTIFPEDKGFYSNEVCVGVDGTIWFFGDNPASTAIEDSRTTTYNMRVQAFTPEGERKFGDDGILLSAYDNQSWTICNQYICANRDSTVTIVVHDRRNSNNEEGVMNYTAYRLRPDGTHVWDEDGIPVDNAMKCNSNAAMSICELEDGSNIFAWMWMNTNTAVSLQKITKDGESQWDPMETKLAGSYNDYPYVVDAGNNQFVLVWGRSSSEYLSAMKYNADGTEAWSKRVTIYDGGFGDESLWTFLDVKPSGDGGVICAWHDDRTNSNIPHAYMAYVKNDGTLGMTNAEGGADIRLSYTDWNQYYPDVYPDGQGTGFIAVYRQTSGGQSWGNIAIQHVSMEGELLYGDEGIDIMRIDDEPKSVSYISIKPGSEGTFGVFYQTIYSYYNVLCEMSIRNLSDGQPRSEYDAVIPIVDGGRYRSGLKSLVDPSHDCWYAFWEDGGSNDNDRRDALCLQRVGFDGSISDITNVNALDNAIYVELTEGRIGGTKDISVKLKNSYPVRGFQFTLELPEGANINSWALNTNRLPSGATLSDKIATQKIEGNKITVACSLNYGDATFIGNDGEIATVNVSFGDDMEVGTYPIYLTSCDVTTASGVDEDLSDVKATLVLEDYVVGDANGDGKVRIGDVTTILNYIVGTTSDKFNEKAADANGDGKIRIGDATTILNIIVNQ